MVIRLLRVIVNRNRTVEHIEGSKNYIITLNLPTDDNIILPRRIMVAYQPRNVFPHCLGNIMHW